LIGALPDDEYTTWSGTSGAAPLVSGLAALIRAEHPEMSAHQVIQCILETAQDTGEAGQDNLYGRGIVDAAAAVNADVPNVDSNPMDSIAAWSTLHRRGEIEDTSSTEDTREVAGPIDYPTDLPVAAQLEDTPTTLQATVVIGFAILLLAVIVLTVLFARQRN